MPERESGRRAVAAAILVAIVCAAHWPGSATHFAQDDQHFVVDNASLRSARGALRGLVSAFPPGQPERGLYRPVTHLSYAVDFHLFGEEARGYHATNVVLYAAVVLLLHAFALRLGLSRGAAFAAAVLFAAHPVHCEAVDSIAGRSELLALLFSLASLLALLRLLRHPGLRADAKRGQARASLGWGAAALAAYAAAAGSKETGVLLVVPTAAALLGECARRPSTLQPRRALALLGAFAGVGAFALALRVAVLGRFGPEPAQRIAFDGLGDRLLTSGMVFAHDLRLLVLPQPLQIDAYYMEHVGVQTQASAAALLGLFALLGALGALVALVHRAWRAANAADSVPGGDRTGLRIALVSLSIAFGFLAPVLHFVDIGALMAERFLFAPSAGVVLGVAALSDRALRGAPRVARSSAAAGVALLALAGTVHSAERAEEWRDGLALWRSAAEAAPRSARVWSGLAGAQLQRGELVGARRSLERALELAPTDYGARLNLALLTEREGRRGEAIEQYRAIARGDWFDHLVFYNLGRAEALEGRFAAAREHLRRALALAPHDPRTRRLLDELEPAP